MTSNRYYGDDIRKFSITTNGEEVPIDVIKDIKVRGTPDEQWDVTVEITYQEFDDQAAKFWRGDVGDTFDVVAHLDMTDTSDLREEYGDPYLHVKVQNAEVTKFDILNLDQGEFVAHTVELGADDFDTEVCQIEQPELSGGEVTV